MTGRGLTRGSPPQGGGAICRSVGGEVRRLTHLAAPNNGRIPGGPLGDAGKR
ncbi:hypothetical protein [Methanoculleus chikugoensis]|uniref:hypothetical protein n=1 Tax=Methanoculleus chikugoensis TaxID=118126 RepID=UPI001FB53009|nr:hypothetical protein [Methanoculleus chikugoensis]